MAHLILKPGRDKSVLLRHPWIFSGAIDSVQGDPGMGDTVDILNSQGENLGKAAYSPFSSIRARMWTWDQTETVDVDFFHRKLNQALLLRSSLGLESVTDALRLVHAESDRLPGIIVDRYSDWLVVQCLTAGAEKWRTVVLEVLMDLTGIRQVYERSDVEVRQLEGLPERKGLVYGDQCPNTISIIENEQRFLVDIQNGQKTGFFLDQRANRQKLRNMAQGRSVLNCFCYTGAFTIYALAGGADKVLSIDSSAAALALAGQQVSLNGFASDNLAWIEGDVFHELRALRDRASQFDLIILDPPKFAPTAAQAERAARGYKDINLLAFKLLRPGGLLYTFSCSGGISEDLFKKIVTGAAQDAGVNAVIVDYLHQGSDHPVSLNFPEGAYLKGLVCRIS